MKKILTALVLSAVAFAPHVLSAADIYAKKINVRPEIFRPGETVHFTLDLSSSARADGSVTVTIEAFGNGPGGGRLWSQEQGVNGDRFPGPQSTLSVNIVNGFTVPANAPDKLTVVVHAVDRSNGSMEFPPYLSVHFAKQADGKYHRLLGVPPNPKAAQPKNPHAG